MPTPILLVNTYLEEVMEQGRVMDLQKLMLKTMLWLLAAAAVLGCFAILVSASDIVWRIAGTFFAAAMAAGASMHTASLTNRRETQRLGTIGLAMCLVCFLMSLVSIWSEYLGHVSNQVQGQLWLTTMATTLLSALGFGFLRLGLIAPHRTCSRVGVGACVIEWILLLIAIWGTNLGPNRDKVVETAGICGACFAIACGCLANVDARDGRWWRWAGIATAAAMLCLWLYGTWIERGDGERVIITLATISILVGYANLIMLIPLRASHERVRRLTIGSAAITGTLLILLTWNEAIGVGSDALLRFCSASSIITACGTLSLAILHRMGRQHEIAPRAAFDSLQIICPRCAKAQRLARGGATCTQCHLRITVHLESSFCPACDFCLDGVQGDQCPECGASLKATQPIRRESPFTAT